VKKGGEQDVGKEWLEMDGLLSWKLKEYGFICAQADEKEELYYLETGRSTTLFIDGKNEPHPEFDEEFYFNFYKRTFYKDHPNEDTVYAEHLDCEQIIKRVQTYFKNRKRYIALKEQERTGRKRGF